MDPTLVQGPCHAITGHASIKACTALAALAQALHETQKVALVLCAKTKNVKATFLGALVPGETQSQSQSQPKPEEEPKKEKEPGNIPLYLVTLPFSGETKQIPADDWREETTEEQTQVACDLIDALWLSDDQAHRILNQADPFQRAWKATVTHRAVHPTATNLIVPRPMDDYDPLGTPADIKEKAQGPIHQFRQTFPLTLKPAADKDKTKQGAQSLTFKNFVEERG